jgi:hypothetical protein
MQAVVVEAVNLLVVLQQVAVAQEAVEITMVLLVLQILVAEAVEQVEYFHLEQMLAVVVDLVL